MNLLFHFHYSSDRSSRIGLASHVFVVLLVATELNRLQAKDNEVLTRSSTDGSSGYRRLDVSESLQGFSVNRPTKRQRKFVKTESAYNFQKGLSVSTEETILNRLLPAKKTGNAGIRVTCSLPYSKANKKCQIELTVSTASSDLTYDDREIGQIIEKNETLSRQMEFGKRNTPGTIPKLTKNIKNYVLNHTVLDKRETIAKVDDKTRKFIIVFPNAEVSMDGIIHDYPFQGYVDDHQLGTINLQLEIFKQDNSSDYEINIKVMAIRNREQFDSKSVIILKASQETKVQNRNSSEIRPGPKTTLFQIDKPIFVEAEIAPNIISRIEIKQENLNDSSPNLGKQKVSNENNTQINKTILTVVYNLTWNGTQPEETMPPFMYVRKTPVNKIIPVIDDQEKTVTNVQSFPTKQSTLGNLKVTLQPQGPYELDKNFKINAGHNDSARIKECPNCTIHTNTTSKDIVRTDLTIGSRKIAIAAIPQKTDGEEDSETGKIFRYNKTFTTKIYRFTPQNSSAESEVGQTKTEIPLSICKECPNEEKYWSAKVLKQTLPFPYRARTDFLTNNTSPDHQPVRFPTTKSFIRPVIYIRIPKRPAFKNGRLTSTVQPKNKKALYAKKIGLVKATKLPSTPIKLRLTTINPNEFIFLGVMPHNRGHTKMAKNSL